MADVTREDLRAALAAGIVTEVQAARLAALAETRAGQRAALPADEEPFELFRGFAEIFVSVGIILLYAGFVTAVAAISGPMLPAFSAVLAWMLALYFTRRRRMALPSIVIAIGFAGGVSGTLAIVMGELLENPEGRFWPTVFLLLTGAALVVYFRAFKVPFVALLLGLVLMGLVFIAVDMVIPFANDAFDVDALFDLRHGSGLPVASLVFGVLALAAGLWCDMKDPHRLGRWASTGFWLHLLAAPALVNTLALTAYNVGGEVGNVLLAVTLAGVAALALAIDRRSFLTAGLGYLGVLIAWAIQGTDSPGAFALLLVLLGGFVTFVGAQWTDLRNRLMRALPDFPGKDRLPPYQRTPA
jgi:hypothetical protein